MYCWYCEKNKQTNKKLTEKTSLLAKFAPGLYI